MTTGNQNNKALRAYLDDVKSTLATGQAGEQAYRGAFENLFKKFDGGSHRALHEPLGVPIGQPDFVIQRGGAPVGYVECKDIGTDLEAAEESEQLGRYRNGLHNLILTDYLAFRWYVEGEIRGEARLARRQPNGTVQPIPNGYQDVELLLIEFLKQDMSLVDTPKELAERMAAKARLLRNTVRERLAQNPNGGSVADFRLLINRLLITDANADVVADTYAQTAAYGLFAAWQKRPLGETFTRQSAVFTQMTPFLGNALRQVAGPETEKEIEWIIDDLARLLDRTDGAAIMKGFGGGAGADDPIIHFYEDFLAAYDSEMREKRGVYYTPQPVVSYIVRSIDHLLRNDFGIADGLADKQRIDEGTFHRVTILDPATGTGTFLREVVANVRQTIRDKGLGGIWQQYVKDDLLPRLHGFELLMAPYTISHMSLGLATSAESEINVVLTNTLEPAGETGTKPTMFGVASIQAESSRADDVKRDRPVMVVLGNPPYSGHSANKGTWITDLLRGEDGQGGNGSYFHVDGEPLGERNPKWLNDDYVKFIRFAQWRIEKTGEGVIGFVTNHSYLDNPTFRGMRRSLMETFNDIYILDLHGNALKREKAADGGKDENVFDIRQGVAIALFVKRSNGAGGLATVYHADLRGQRPAKYEQLGAHDVSDTDWTLLVPRAPQHFFIPRNNELETEYEAGFAVHDIFPVNSVGIVTGRDKLTIRWDKDEISRVATRLTRGDTEEIRSEFNLGADSSDWKVSNAQKDVREHSKSSEHVSEILYRPFDVRATYYTGRAGGLMVRPRPQVMRHMLAGRNLGLSVGRAGAVTGSPIWDAFHVTRASTDFNLFRRGGNNLMPLYLYPTEEEEAQGVSVRPNLDAEFIDSIGTATGLTFTADGSGNLESTFGPEDVFHYIYAILHSPTYRTRYADFLKSDFPRIPLTRNRDLFAGLIALGKRLTELHLMEAEPETRPSFPIEGNLRVERVRTSGAGQVYINNDQYFDGVNEATWEFTIGGYRPAEKWLKDRKGRTLSADDVRHYMQMCGALAETQELMAEVDQAIDGAGGWPLA